MTILTDKIHMILGLSRLGSSNAEKLITGMPKSC